MTWCDAAATIHVVPHGDAWAVQRDGRDEPLSTHATQADAEDAGREVARADEVEFQLHGDDGLIRDKHSYGKSAQSA
jgi:hypothetical protein